MKKTKFRILKKGMAFIVILSLMFVLSACGHSTTTISGNLQKADIGNSLVIYTPEPQANMETLLEGFNALYPNCEVEVIYGSAGEMTSRIIAESANPQADIMFNGINSSNGTQYEPYFDKYTSTHNDELFEGCKTNNGYYNYVTISPNVFYVNQTLLKGLGITVSSYQDLLQPELKGLIIGSDPNSASAAWNNLSNILAVNGYDNDQTWNYIDKLMGNGLITISSSSTVLTSVSKGEYAVGLTYESGAAAELCAGVTDCEIVFPEEGNGYFVFANAIVKGCKHYDAAVAWIEYVTSADAQTDWDEKLGTNRPTNASAKLESVYLRDYDSIKWVTRDIDWLVANKTSVLKKWDNIYSKYN